jgi:predicted acylesterase/phospholipase RssA
MLANCADMRTNRHRGFSTPISVIELVLSAILAASASIPVVFPPMLIDAEANGHRFQEMHVDGGGDL